MNAALQPLFDKLEKERFSILAQLKELTGQQLNQRPFKGKWSVNELIAHLITSERLSNQYLKKKMLGMKLARDSGVWEDVKMIVLQLSQRLPLKFKAPKSLFEKTPAFTELDQLETEWESVRLELKGILEKFSDTDLKKKIYRHIYAGRLNIMHALMFLREHIRHHKPQLNRLLKNYRASRSN